MSKIKSDFRISGDSLLYCKLHVSTYNCFLLLMFFICSVRFSSFAAVTDTGKAFDNLRYKLANDEEVTIAYLGGSITQGGGASNRAVTSWRPLTTSWFRKNYPEADVKEVDASWGATGSDLGAFRCTRDVSSKKPDLVFVEFAVNDWKKKSEAIQPYMDGIVRNILRTCPNCVTVFVYTVHNNTIAHYDKNSAPPAVLAQQEVAEHYNICTINIGKAMWQAIKDGRGTLDTYTTDGTHPNDNGYKIYADEIAGVLKRHLLAPAVPDAYTPAALPEPLVANTVDNGVIYMADRLSFEEWNNRAVNEVRFPNQITCNTPGTRLSYTFTGTAIGMYWIPGTDGGQMQWSIDDSPPVVMSAYSWLARGIYPVLTNTLEAGTHTLTMEVLSTRDAGSNGNYIRIGAFFVDEDLPTTPIDAYYERPKGGRKVFNLQVAPQNREKYPVACILNTAVSDYFSVKLFDISGKIGTTLFTGKLEPGSHYINLKNDCPASGMYVIDVTTSRYGRAAANRILVR